MDKVLIVLRKDCVELEKDLKSSYFTVDVTCDVIEALQKIKNDKPKLIIIDMATSRICGADLLKIIRSNPANYHSKIIITARNFNYKFIAEAFDQGADYFIKYPLNIQEIEKIYNSIKILNQYADLEMIAKTNEFEWLSGI